MSTHVHQESIARTPLWRRKQFWRVTLPTVSIVCAVLAGILVYDAIDGTKGVTESSKSSFGTTYATPKAPPTVKFTAEERAVAKEFITTAVARKNLARAYVLSGPGVREGMTLKQFLTGNIAVVPYLVDKTTIAKMAIDQSYAKTATLEIFLDTAHQQGRIFYMDLVKLHGKWYVNAWSPRGSPRIPNSVG